MQSLKPIFFEKKILIYGLAKSGLATFKFLKKKNSEIYCWDDNNLVRKKIKKKDLLKPKKKLSKNFFDFIVVSPGINIRKCGLKNFLDKNKNKIITDLDIFYSFNEKNKIISITGTNGKSTACKLLDKVLKTAGYNTQLLGNIGNPILSTKKTINKTVFIVEISSYQLEYSRYFRSNHAIILNISPDHLERHGTIKNYINSKKKIFKFQSQNDHAYLNLDNRLTKKIIDNFTKSKFISRLHKISKFKIKKIKKKITNKYLLTQNNLENIAFVIKIANNFKISSKNILKGINNFKGLPHRQEKLSLNKKIICINDSKATNFDSSFQSLSSYKNIFWIVGGLPKKGDKFIINKITHNVIKAYIIGKHTFFFEKQFIKKINFVVTKNLKNTITTLIKDLNQISKTKNSNTNKYTILFSPAAASFDQFKNFEERGNQFKQIIYKEKSNIKNVKF